MKNNDKHIFIKIYMGIEIYLNRSNGQFYLDIEDDPKYSRSIYWAPTLNGAEKLILDYVEQDVYVLYEGEIIEVSMRSEDRSTINCIGLPDTGRYKDIKNEYVKKTNEIEAVITATKVAIEKYRDKMTSDCWEKIKKMEVLSK